MKILVSTIMLTLALVAFTVFHLVALLFLVIVALVVPLVDAAIRSIQAMVEFWQVYRIHWRAGARTPITASLSVEA
jgi:formate hydrogenlyase subunit 4